VQFHWDRYSKTDENSSCWVRVAQPLAGKGWGLFNVPRIGQEVLVDFWRAIPTTLVVIGTLYNGEAMPPWACRTTSRAAASRPSPTGHRLQRESASRTRRARRALHPRPEGPDRAHRERSVEQVGNEHHLTVGKDSLEDIGGDHHVNVGGDRNETIGGGPLAQISKDLQCKAGTKVAYDAGTEIHLKAGTTLVLEASATLSLKVGGNFISINSAASSSRARW
jgi:type VI secretion system secreted protein VgrG